MSDILLPFLLFAMSSTFTPGPNNMMLMASGANFGMRATLPHILGISLGFPLMVFAVGLGLGAVFERYPLLHEALRWGGSAYLLWLAWRIATAAGTAKATGRGRPLSFLEAAGFQWVNPKAWIVAVSAFSVYAATDVDPVLQAVLFGGLFCLVALPSTGTWALFGTAIGRFLASRRKLRLFNGAMGLLLAASVALLFV